MAPDPPASRVLILETEDTLKGALASRLESLGYHVALSEPGDAANTVLMQRSFDVIVLALDGVDSGHLRFVERHRQTAEPAEIVILANEATVDSAVRAMKMGAFDYLQRPCRLREVEASVRGAAETRRRRAKGRLEAAFEELMIEAHLTYRELDIVRALLRGQSNKVIAESLEITEHTVKTHLKNLFSKLKVGSRVEILSLVFRRLEAL